jgi:long-chain acyl-CoA synthetase
MSRSLQTVLGATAALDDGQRLWDRNELLVGAQQLAAHLLAQGTRVLATLLDNGLPWLLADLAATEAGLVHVPLPLFFSPEQLQHALAVGGVDTLLLPPTLAARWPQLRARTLSLGGQDLALLRLPAPAPALPAGTAKITFTSGTTGAPKGVCLDGLAMQRVAAGLVQALEPLGVRRHLCALPLAVLLENIAGLMAPLLRGATCITPPLAELGLSGSSSFDAQCFDAAVRRFRPDSLILLPQMLRAWSADLERRGQRAPTGLKLVAVGGAAVGAKLLAQARGLGIPAYEGYGLSEGASVQTLNLPDGDRPGSAGRVLPHAELRVAADGEIELRGSVFLGYLGDAASPPDWWPSGDLGHIDDAGFVHISGRKKHLLITGFGRNVAPEWVETALRGEPAIAQAVVYGEGMSALCAVLWPGRAYLEHAALQAAVDAANAGLPDYARVRRWIRARAAFSPETGLATANGRPQRGAIWRAHQAALAGLLTV